MIRSTCRTLREALAMTLLALPAVATAQVEEDKDEAAVESFALEPEAQRESLVEQAAEQGASTFSLEELEEAVDVSVVERTEAAVSQLRRLVDDTPVEEASRAEYMFRLAELYYDRARFYEQRSFERRDQANELRSSNPERARAYDENAAADLAQSDSLSDEAIALYAEIYELYRDSYAGIDGVLYYLGQSLLKLERSDAARMIFEELALNFPRSDYLPQAFLMLGELDFVENNPESAYAYYEAVTAFPDSSVYPYALYKQAWCLFNLAQSEEDYQAAVQLLYDSVVAFGDDERLARQKRDALRDMTIFYAQVYPPELAWDFFMEIAPNEAFDLLARLARIYGERADYRASNELYEELIRLNSESFSIVSYQREIVRNIRPVGTPVEIVREVRRLVEVFELAQSFADATPEAIGAAANDLEQLVRQLATTYHSEAQTTQNEELYALAYNLYQDYATLFPESEYASMMWFYYAELLYKNEEWLAAARAYEESLAKGGDDNRYETEATLAACLAYMKMVDVSESNTVEYEGGSAEVGDEDLPPIPERQEIPEDYTRFMTACDRFLATDPPIERAVEVDYVTAYMYYSFNHLDEATTRFGAIAMNYNGVDPQRAQVSAELLLDSLALERRFDEMKEWIDTFKATPALNTGSFAERLQLLSEQVDFKVCRDMQVAGNSREAGHCYIRFVEEHQTSSLGDRALFNASIAFEAGAQLDYSISANRALVQYFPDSPLVSETLYELGRTYHRMAMYDQSAGYYEQYVQEGENADHARDALINASQFRSGLGQHDQAIADLRAFIRVADEDDEEQRAAQSEAEFQIGLVLEDAGREREAISQYESFIEDEGEILPGRALEAHGHISELYATRDMEDLAYEWYQNTLNYWDSLAAEAQAEVGGAARDAVARAQFMMGERIFEQFEAVPLTGNEAAVQAALAEKIRIGAEAATVYSRVLEFGRPGWAIASFTRLGQLYHVFYEQVIDAPIPPDLEGVMLEEYQRQIEEQAAVQKDEAMTRYAEAIRIAREAGYFSEWSERAASLYQELDPTFKAGSEIALDPGFGGSDWYQSGFITEYPTAEEDEAIAPAGDGSTK